MKNSYESKNHTRKSKLQLKTSRWRCGKACNRNFFGRIVFQHQYPNSTEKCNHETLYEVGPDHIRKIMVTTDHISEQKQIRKK